MLNTKNGNPFRAKLIVVFLLLFSAKSFAKGIECETDNAALRAMGDAIVSFERADGSQFELTVKLADNNATRAAGFQRVCAETIAAKAILFVFQRDVQPSFHMNNVVAPIDIAFIGKTGNIDSIQSMQPYILMSNSRPLYSPKQPVRMALETHPNFFSDNRLGLDTTVGWRKAE